MNQFEPVAARATRLRREMDSALWFSVRETLETRGFKLPSEYLGAMPATAFDYAAYADLAFPNPRGEALCAELQADAADFLLRRLHAGLETAPPAGKPAHIVNLDSASFSDAERARLIRWWDSEATGHREYLPATSDEFDEASLLISQTCGLIEKASPELFGEIGTILNELVLLKPEQAQPLDFAAGSSFALWGAIIVNVGVHHDWIRYCKTIVHEAGHSYLFAVAREDPLVFDPATETHASPLRAEPRPMDGIFHGAFVKAREALAFDQLLSWQDRTGELSHSEVERLNRELEDSVIYFWQCHEKLRAQGSLTELGASIIGDCEDFMNRKFALVTH